MKGLGDAVARVIEAVGIKPCDDCKPRQAALNRAFPFSPAVAWKLTLPEGFRLRKQGQKTPELQILLAQSGKSWATWECTGTGLQNMHEFTDEAAAREDFEIRMKA